MADVEEPHDSRFDDIDLESILARVERRGPLTFTRKRCLYRAPEFVKKLPKEETVEEGSTVKFECKAVGFPKPTVNWTKDLELLPDNPRITFQYGELGEASIEIQKIKKSDEGSYRCKAENTEGSCTSSVYISIKVKPKSPKRSQQRVITFTSHFTTITERIEEEEREAAEFMRQPMSPLTYLYDSITIKEKPWPQFLGNWAFLASDFDGMDENMDTTDDEDVFLPGTIETRGSHNNFNPERESDTDNSFDNDLNNSTIPNLIFENKNLVNCHKDLNLNYSLNKCDNRVVKDENSNNRLSTPVNSQDTSSNGIDNRAKNNICDKNNTCDLKKIQNSDMENFVRNNINDNKTVVKQQPKRNKDSNTTTKIPKDKTSSQTRPLATSLASSPSSQTRPLATNLASSLTRPLVTSKVVSKPNPCQQKTKDWGFKFMLFICVISGLTFLALTADVATPDFVFTVFIGQVIYLFVKYLCNYS